jgi:hypothetical protein
MLERNNRTRLKVAPVLSAPQGMGLADLKEDNIRCLISNVRRSSGPAAS